MFLKSYATPGDDMLLETFITSSLDRKLTLTWQSPYLPPVCMSLFLVKHHVHY